MAYPAGTDMGRWPSAQACRCGCSLPDPCQIVVRLLPMAVAFAGQTLQRAIGIDVGHVRTGVAVATPTSRPEPLQVSTVSASAMLSCLPSQL